MLFLGVILTLGMLIALCAWWSLRTGRGKAMRCAGCSYDLGGCDARTTEACPECGAVIAERGVEFRGPVGGRRRTRWGFAIALLCALGMGGLMVLRYPPVMQTVRTTREGAFVGTNLAPPIEMREEVVTHPGYATSPLEHVFPSLTGPATYVDSFILTYGKETPTPIDIRECAEPSVAAINWARMRTPPIENGHLRLLVTALRREGFSMGRALGMLEPEYRNIQLHRHNTSFIITQVSATPTPQQSSISIALGLAPRIGADWERTTWVQRSSAVWYVLPSVVVFFVFCVLGRSRRLAAVNEVERWRGRGGVA